MPTFYFFPASWGVLNVALAAGLYAAILDATDATEPAFKWTMVAATMIVGGALLAWLRLTARRSREEREHLLAQVENLARTDELTPLPNRRMWDEELPQEIARARRHDTGFAVAIIDIDHFKALNDAQGHPAGDEFLIEAAAAWAGSLRANDLIARLGGEEFGVLLPYCDPPEAAEIIERLRSATPRGQTCSAGIAYWDGIESQSALVRRADAALYEAKHRGRDRAVVSPRKGPVGLAEVSA